MERHLRGNGQWVFKPSLKPGEVEKAAWAMSGLTPLPEGGLRPSEPHRPGRVTFRVSSANAICGMVFSGEAKPADPSVVGKEETGVRLRISRDNGLHWSTQSNWSKAPAGQFGASYIEPVSGAYELLLVVELTPAGALHEHRLGLEVAAGEQPQLVIPAGSWFGARVAGGGFALVSCTVAPGFDFADFEAGRIAARRGDDHIHFGRFLERQLRQHAIGLGILAVLDGIQEFGDRFRRSALLGRIRACLFRGGLVRSFGRRVRNCCGIVRFIATGDCAQKDCRPKSPTAGSHPMRLLKGIIH